MASEAEEIRLQRIDCPKKSEHEAGEPWPFTSDELHLNMGEDFELSDGSRPRGVCDCNPDMWGLLLQGSDGSEIQSYPNARNLASLGEKNRADARKTTL